MVRDAFLSLLMTLNLGHAYHSVQIVRGAEWVSGGYQASGEDGKTIIEEEVVIDLHDRAEAVAREYFHRDLPDGLEVLASGDILDQDSNLGVTLYENGKPKLVLIDRNTVDYSSTLTDCIISHELSHVFIARRHNHDKAFRKEFAKAILNGACGGRED